MAEKLYVGFGHAVPLPLGTSPGGKTSTLYLGSWQGQIHLNTRLISSVLEAIASSKANNPALAASSGSFRLTTIIAELPAVALRISEEATFSFDTLHLSGAPRSRLCLIDTAVSAPCY
jgi:hypothetical protein